jgi:N,N'-diacetyllegionaminate synthase
MIIDGIDTDKRVFIVAEIGNNHEGDVETAREMVRSAAACGVDAVKFQTFRSEHYVSQSDADRFERLKRFELTYEQFEELAHLTKSLGLRFLSTPFDLLSAAFLDGIVDAFKVASGDNNFYPLIERIAATGKPIIISLGLAGPEQVRDTYEFVHAEWRRRSIAGQLALLHCVSSYPVPPDQANLQAIPYLSDNFACTTGYSDHTIGNEAAVLSVALGARIIEKHFTLDKHYSDFRDHQLSAEPDDMRDLVNRVREAEAMLGTRDKLVQPVEQTAAGALRRSIVAGGDLPENHVLALADLTWTRPSGGLAPGSEHLLVGKRLKRAVHFGDPLSEADVA